MERPATLYELQQLEQHLEQALRKLKSLPVLEQHKLLREQVAREKEEAEKLLAAINEQRRLVKRLELEIQKIVQESNAVNQKLYDGSVSSAKELEMLQAKEKTLQRDKTATEEKALKAMEKAEQLEKDFKESSRLYRQHSRELGDLQQSGNKEIKELKEQIQTYRERREHLQQQLDQLLLEKYNTMKQHFHGRPVAIVQDDTCSGCRVTVSSNLKNRLYNPNILNYCENCGRILFLPAAEEISLQLP